MSTQVLFVDFSSDNSVRITMARPGNRPPPANLYHCASLGELDTALQDFLGRAEAPDLMAAALSVCGWERDGAFEMPNHSYRIERSWLKDRLNISRLHLVNDCVATALAIERLEGPERHVICDGKDDPTQMKAMIAIGRGLGTTCIFTDEMGNPVAMPCAGGHSDLPATTEREFAIVSRMAQTFGHVSRVRAVSTAGLVEVYNLLNTIDGQSHRASEATDIVERARNADALAQEAIALVTGWLAATASDTALCTGARGGVFLAGSFFDLLGDMFDPAYFARRFCAKGRLTSYLEDIPVYLVQTQEPEMVGLSTLFA
ncbi:hypothetical protein AEAC466_05605 [Asticcacaulis sp. AC466]|uniref:glucokinase n=1 Tax=Asticcacaulis sp. AC466 TaxID=1282362 RepID=UPI0003C3F3A5|nr:glucokinase [Asticcacaulis sp. AC466]ESQ85185.1 hypothetical protein AEAC466_05605 [Asticcacaulis sp. AC466]